jgi:hypothetical protein
LNHEKHGKKWRARTDNGTTEYTEYTENRWRARTDNGTTEYTENRGG